MQYTIRHKTNKYPNMYWQSFSDSRGWKQATVFAGEVVLEVFGPLPTAGMVFDQMHKKGYFPYPEDIPEGWTFEVRQNLSTKDITRLFLLNGNQASAACRNGSLSSSVDNDGRFLIAEDAAADWFLSRQKGRKKKARPATSKECLRCKTKMVKDGIGKVPLICPLCFWPRLR